MFETFEAQLLTGGFSGSVVLRVRTPGTVDLPAGDAKRVSGPQSLLGSESHEAQGPALRAGWPQGRAVHREVGFWRGAAPFDPGPLFMS